MSQHRVSARYAKSLIDLAQQQNQLPAIKADMDMVGQVLHESRELDKVLESPIINSGKKTAILQAIFGGKLTPLTSKFIDTVIAKKREPLMQEIVDAFMHQYDIINNRTNITIITAVTLNDASRKHILDYLEKFTAKTVTLTCLVDTAIIGGFVIKLEDSLYDASIARQLKDIQKELLNSYISKN
jgi:F-type H+-transporting ATPase subunit delta